MKDGVIVLNELRRIANMRVAQNMHMVGEAISPALNGYL